MTISLNDKEERASDMTYEESIKFIYDTAAFGSKLGLDNIRTLMSILGNPQDILKIIHIAGTNGKGSTAAYMLSVLEEAGYRTGFYTSPELYRFSERIRINEDEISNDDTAYYATKIRKAAEYMAEHDLGNPSEFELVLAMAFCYFCDKAVDVVILEVGLGGRLDATNVISRSLLSVITKISFDHMQYLGDTLPQIAGEKAAIIKPHGKVIVYPAGKDVMAVFEKRCREQQAELHVAELPEQGTASLTKGQTFMLSGNTYTTKMAGLYEINNAALAIQAIRLLTRTSYNDTNNDVRNDGFDLNISDKNIFDGICRANWPGRFEILKHKPLIIADGAHNEDGAKALSKTLTEYFGEEKVTLCLGILKDKEYEKMLIHLLPHADRVIACDVPNPRSLTAYELTKLVNKANPGISTFICHTAKEAYERIQEEKNNAAAFIICGSLYLVGPMRELYLNE